MVLSFRTSSSISMQSVPCTCPLTINNRFTCMLLIIAYWFHRRVSILGAFIIFFILGLFPFLWPIVIVNTKLYHIVSYIFKHPQNKCFIKTVAILLTFFLARICIFHCFFLTTHGKKWLHSTLMVCKFLHNLRISLIFGNSSATHKSDKRIASVSFCL